MTEQAILEERMRRLAQANRVRLRRSQWKQRIRSREATLTDVMGDPLTDSMKVVELLLALPRVGRVKASKVMRHLGVSPTTSLGSLTYRQRVELERAFRGV